MTTVASDKGGYRVGTHHVPRHEIYAAKVDWELAQRRSKDPLLYHDPHEKQASFHRSGARFRSIFGGNQSGKTTALLAEVTSAALGFYPWRTDGKTPTLAIRPESLPDESRFQLTGPRAIRVPNLGLVLGNGVDDGIKTVLLPKLREIAGPYIARETKSIGGAIGEIEWANGSRTMIRSYGKDAAKFAGSTISYVAVDEPMPEDVWTEVRRGLIALGGRAWFAMTPLSEPWMYDQLFTRAAQGDPDYFAIEISYWDNDRRERDDENWVAHLTDEEAETRVFGRFFHLSGLVYKEWDREVHLVDPFPIPQEWPRWQVVDPHDRRPFFIIWAAVAPDDSVYIYREWPDRPFEEMTSSDIDIDGYTKLFQNLEDGESIDFRVMDPAFGRQLRGGTTVQDEFDRRGYYFDCTVKNDIQVGHLKVKEYLRFDRARPVDTLNRPRLYVFRTCRNTAWCFEHYIWAEARHAGPAREVVREVGKDGMDCVRYLCMSEPRHRRPAAWNRYALAALGAGAGYARAS